MLTEKCFTLEWIESHRRRLKSRDPQLIEKCIMAFEVVGRLSDAGLEFIFKGGTSLLLHLNPIRRLSIDADITTPASLKDLQTVIDEITRNPPFTGYTYQDERERENPPTRYFQIHYNSPTQKKPWSIQLDVQLGKNHYGELETKPIEMELLEIEKPQTVRIPTVEGLLGDKLTAFAPSTIGVLYEPKPRKLGGSKPVPDPTRVLKHMFDIGELFTMATDLKAISATYDSTHKIQNIARGGFFTRDQCIDDTIDAAYHVAELGLHSPIDNEKTRFFKKGIQPLDNHLLGPRFNIHTAGIPAARTALMAALLKSRRFDTPLYDICVIPPSDKLAGITMDGRFERLTSLRKLSLESFHYWNLVAGHLKENQ